VPVDGRLLGVPRQQHDAEPGVEQAVAQGVLREYKTFKLKLLLPAGKNIYVMQCQTSESDFKH
jgi:hypothetical protein